MRVRMIVAVLLAALFAVGTVPAVVAARGGKPPARPTLPGEATPSGWVIRPSTPIYPAPSPASMVRRTSGGTASYVTMFCFGHYARQRGSDVWIYGEITDGHAAWRREGWLWAGDLLTTGPPRLPYC